MTTEMPPRQPSNGAGCWLTGIVSTFIALILVIAGLFLPPIDLYNRLLGANYSVLQAAGETIQSTDETFSLALATDVNGEFGIRLNTVSLANFEAANADAGDWIPAAKNAAPYYLALQSAVYDIETSGTLPERVQLTVDIPNNTVSTDLLDLYGWYEDEGGRNGRWEFLAAAPQNGQLVASTDRLPRRVAVFQAAPDTPDILVTYDVVSVLTPEVAAVASIIAPAGLQPTLDGSVAGSLAPGFDTTATYRVMPVIRDFSDPNALDTQTVEAIIGNRQLRDSHIQQLLSLTNTSGFDGLFIDYRGLPAEQRQNFTAFIEALSASLRSNGRLLGVVVPVAENVAGTWETSAYDWQALGAASDYLSINLRLNPDDYLPGETQFVEALLRWTTTQVDRYKVLLGLTASSVREIADTYTTIGYDESLAGLGDVVVEADTTEAGTLNPGSEIRAYLDGRDAIAGVDTRTNAPFIDYLDNDGNATARIWLTTGDALRYRMDRTIPFALGGVAFGDLLASDLASDVLPTISRYQAQIPSAPSPTRLALRWRIETTEGLLSEVTTGLNEDLVTRLEAPDGNYAINVAVVGVGEDTSDQADRASVRTGASVALFRPTATPTPLPTQTPTPTPTVTPSPAPIVATALPAAAVPAQAGAPANNAPTGGGFAAIPVGAGSINMSGFEYGGHVTSTASIRAAEAMRSAGMTWMKVQIRYGPGAGADIAAGAITSAHSQGFKIVVGTVGNPADLAAGGEGYVASYAGWLGGIAALGADAIEVWNEPNIDREWPNGQISGTAYASMLRQSYQQIKSNNPGTIVISGAPAPTGAEAAFPGAVMNDDNFLRQMVAAGGMQFLDCVGMHYNEGIVPPTQAYGDPRGNYYTRYFDTMINTYWSVTGGQKPICITELGYLTAEGYPPLSQYWSWASNVTVSQQATWLAQAAARASQSGRVRMMIVWNIDFTFYGTSDPQAGFAIIRPGGGCPACSALSGAR